MRPVPAALLRAIRGSHHIAVRATLVTGWTEGVSPGGEQIPVVAGDVTLDSTAQVMGTLSLTTDGHGWSTRPGRHLIQPYGTEVFIERGVVAAGSTQWVSQGYYRIDQVAQAGSPNGNLVISGSDRMQGIIDAQMPAPIQFTATQAVADVFTSLVGGVYPEAGIDYDWDAGSDELGAALITTQDRYGTLNNLLLSRGKIMYWDYAGRLQVRTQPLDSGPPVWDVTAGPDGVIIQGSRTLTRDGVFNAVVVQGSGASTSQAPLALVYDNNPVSPTYWHGRFGQIPQFYSDPSVVTQDQAVAAGTTMLAKSIQLPFQVGFDCIPNPALEPYDVVRVNYGSPSADELHIIDTLTIPLTASTAMTGTGHDPSAVIIAQEGM